MQKANDALLVAMLVSAGAVALSAQSPAPETRAREIFKQLVEINTTHSVGSTTTAADAMAVRLRGAGFTDVRVLEPVPRKGNLVVRYPGNGTKRPLLLLAHLVTNPTDLLTIVSAAPAQLDRLELYLQHEHFSRLRRLQ